jgi:hypothetical protein
VSIVAILLHYLSIRELPFNIGGNYPVDVPQSI